MSLLHFVLLLVAMPRLNAHPCVFGTHNVPARCGTLTVYEDRAAMLGRTISLHFIVLKAKHPSGHAIAFNPGGPGVPVTKDAPVFADGDGPGEFTTLRDRYDILLLDVRGTGKSAPQECDFAPLAHPELYFAQLWPDAIVERCHQQLAAKANLSLYSTTAAAADLDDLRAALGYRKLVLDGGSYGTTLYLAYARQFPDRVESMILRGAGPPHFVINPLQDARGFQGAISDLFRECKADAACNRQFPLFEKHFAAVAERFERGGVSVVVRNDVTNRLQTVRLSREVFFDRLREALYNPSNAAYVPIVIERAYEYDYKPLGQLIDQIAQSFVKEQSDGLNLSVTCAEDIPFITEQAVRLTSAHTWEGDARVRAQQRACRMWKVHAVPASFMAPVRSSAPILMISGSDDPTTPPIYAYEVLPYLPNARILLIKGGSHQTDTPCVDRIADRFVRTSTASGLNLSACGDAYRRPAFAASLRYYELGSDGDAMLNERFRRVAEQLFRGHLDRAQLEPALSKQFSAEVVRQIADQAALMGGMWKFSYDGMKTSVKGNTYDYTVGLGDSYFIGTFTLDKQNRISAMDISP